MRSTWRLKEKGKKKELPRCLSCRRNKNEWLPSADQFINETLIIWWSQQNKVIINATKVITKSRSIELDPTTRHVAWIGDLKITQARELPHTVVHNNAVEPFVRQCQLRQRFSIQKLRYVCPYILLIPFLLNIKKKKDLRIKTTSTTNLI